MVLPFFDDGAFLPTEPSVYFICKQKTHFVIINRISIDYILLYIHIYSVEQESIYRRIHHMYIGVRKSAPMQPIHRYYLYMSCKIRYIFV